MILLAQNDVPLARDNPIAKIKWALHLTVLNNVRWPIMNAIPIMPIK